MVKTFKNLLQKKILVKKKVKVIISTLIQNSHILTVLNILKATGPVETIFHVEPPGMEETKICSNYPGHMTKMASMPIYGKNL